MNMNDDERLQRLAALDAVIAARWQEIVTHPLAAAYLGGLMSGDRRVYALYMMQVYHYASHTPRNQALVGANRANVDVRYQRYCFEHALEETGHDLMAVKDLRAIGLDLRDPLLDLPRPLPATELIVAWLYWVSTHDDPVARLGYTYWAERSYDLVRPFMEAAKGKMGLGRSDMTFFFAHSEVDVKHAGDVRRILLAVCEREEHWAAVQRTAEVTLRLTLDMLVQIHEEYVRVSEGRPSDYARVLRGLS